jgi:hypothetical protein
LRCLALGDEGKSRSLHYRLRCAQGPAEMTCSLLDPVSRHRDMGHSVLVAVKASYRILEASMI